jgi:urea transport system permease protein
MAPKSMDAAASIFFIAGVALGGRATLFGPVLGALAIGYGQSTLSERWPGAWIYVLGLLFVVVTIALPGGIAALASRSGRLVARLRPSNRKAVAA